MTQTWWHWASLGDGIFVNDAFGTAHRHTHLTLVSQQTLKKQLLVTLEKRITTSKETVRDSRTSIRVDSWWFLKVSNQIEIVIESLLSKKSRWITYQWWDDLHSTKLKGIRNQ